MVKGFKNFLKAHSDKIKREYAAIVGLKAELEAMGFESQNGYRLYYTKQALNDHDLAVLHVKVKEKLGTALYEFRTQKFGLFSYVYMGEIHEVSLRVHTEWTVSAGTKYEVIIQFSRYERVYNDAS